MVVMVWAVALAALVAMRPLTAQTALPSAAMVVMVANPMEQAAAAGLA
jgi:hypothetical protein